MIKKIVPNFIELKEVTFNAGFVGVTLGGSTKPAESKEILSEIYTLRNILSEICYRLRVLEIHLTSEGIDEDEEDELEANLANSVYLLALDHCMAFSEELYKSKYFMLLAKKDRKNLDDFLNFIKFEKFLYEIDEESYDLADSEGKIKIMMSILEIYNGLTEEILKSQQ